MTENTSTPSRHGRQERRQGQRCSFVPVSAVPVSSVVRGLRALGCRTVCPRAGFSQRDGHDNDMAVGRDAAGGLKK